MNRFDFGSYSVDELEYVCGTLEKLMQIWHNAEVALSEAHIRNDEETLNKWTDVYHALAEAKRAMKAKR